MKPILFLILILPTIVFAKYELELIKDDLDIIWGIAFVDDSLLITERNGTLKLINLKTKKVIVIDGVPKVYKRGQGGLLDIKLHPKFKENKRVYLTYAKSVKGSKTTALGFGLLKSNKLEGFKDIFVAKGTADKRIHFGSRITFDENNKIFMSVGERGLRENAQNLKNNFGKIMRFNDDGSIPDDNPFVGESKKLDSIWSYGHRNPQGLFYDLKTKTLYEMEHGPRGGDEINVIKKGANYGWPLASYGKEYWNPFSVGDKKVKGTEQPLKFYDPSIAPSDLILYRGDKFKELQGALISGSLVLTHLNIYHPETKKEIRLFKDKEMRVRAVNTNDQGEIYIGVDNGRIYKLIETKK